MHTTNLWSNTDANGVGGVPFTRFSESLSEALYGWLWEMVE